MYRLENTGGTAQEEILSVGALAITVPLCFSGLAGLSFFVCGDIPAPVLCQALRQLGEQQGDGQMSAICPQGTGACRDTRKGHYRVASYGRGGKLYRVAKSGVI